MTHAEMNELYDLYSLGVLSFEESVEIDTHLAEGCEYCLGHIRDSVNFTSGLSALAETVAAPATLKERVLSSVRLRSAKQTNRQWMAGLSALAAAFVGVALFSVWSVSHSQDVKRQLGIVSDERDQLRSALQILTEQQTRTVRFGNSENPAHGWLFVNRDSGFVFVGADLPQISSEKTFELWFIPVKGNPAPANLFRTGRDGRVVLTSKTGIGSGQYAAVAVTVEPKQGSTAPTTKPFLVVPLS